MSSCNENYNCKAPSFLERIFQKSTPEDQPQDLKKCLNLFDLTVQGLAHIIGTGIFIMTPGIIKMIAGPGMVVSYLISAAVLVFTVLSYMDLGARFKGIGNAYVYVYASLGEFAAGLIGIFILTELALGLALVSVGFGQNVEMFFMNGHGHNLHIEYSGSHLIKYFAQNVNIMAILLIVICCCINCAGIKKVVFTNIFTVSYSVLALTMYCILSLIYGSTKTFAHSTDPDTGRGGVFPYGAAGVITGAAVTVVSYTGFETVVSLSAEANNSKRDVPLAIVLSFGLTTVIYVSVTLAIVYLAPWYSLDEGTGIPGSLEAHNLTIPKHIIIGAIMMASASLVLCTLTTLARGLMVLSEDGLIFKCLSCVAECTKVPIAATVTAAGITIVFTLAFSYEILIHLVSGGALLTFAAVCYCLIIISYTRTTKHVTESSRLIENEVVPSEAESTTSSLDLQDSAGYIQHQEWKVVFWMASFWKLLAVAIILFYWPTGWDFWHVRVPLMVLLGLINISILSYIKFNYYIQPQTDPGFVCPGIPFVPAMGITLNLALFSALDLLAHMMTVAYFAVGFVIYFGYGYFHSRITLRKQKEMEMNFNNETQEMRMEES